MSANMASLEEASLASQYFMRYDLRSAWFFVRMLGTRSVRVPLPSPACNRIISFLGQDWRGRVPGDLPVSRGSLAMLQYQELCHFSDAFESDGFYSDEGSTTPSEPNAANSASSSSEQTPIVSDETSSN
eukprot:TRINITY_DN33767_c0_g1_i1.p1 TRINITY_DN33767_c0_g1~~TRINITY_DN33767_c0_g1_i1.p1  ORF type:complete len:129 (+),score=13.30 TRINITY_DN33767_c0_g1_i1:55-441(+)